MRGWLRGVLLSFYPSYWPKHFNAQKSVLYAEKSVIG